MNAHLRRRLGDHRRTNKLPPSRREDSPPALNPATLSGEVPAMKELMDDFLRRGTVDQVIGLERILAESGDKTETEDDA